MDLTIGGLWIFLLGRFPASPPPWPPDVFALCASVLQRSGAYLHVVERWPPTGSAADWKARIQNIADQWRSIFVSGSPLPAEILDWWSVVARSKDLCGFRK